MQTDFQKLWRELQEECQREGHGAAVELLQRAFEERGRKLREAAKKANIDLLGAEMLLQNKTINATGALADESWQPGREHIDGMRRTMEQALEEIASARQALKETPDAQ